VKTLTLKPAHDVEPPDYFEWASQRPRRWWITFRRTDGKPGHPAALMLDNRGAVTNTSHSGQRGRG
jgi:hypothetical protein